ncbi:MAG: ElyC/SanA/YdcF family protein [Desulfobacula sp.]
MAGFVVVYTAAATFLNYHEEPRPSDAVVLFIGPDYPERKKEALQLMEEGYADRLLIPALNQVLTRVDGKVKQTGRPDPDGLDRSIYPEYYENTHVEALEAKTMMDTAGYTSAIFVSSPYHMRRISMISKAVFQDEKYQLTFRGSRYARTDGFFPLFRWSKIEQVFEEYLKIAGFLAYRFYEKVLA